jgi:hypothetical protein
MSVVWPVSTSSGVLHLRDASAVWFMTSATHCKHSDHVCCLVPIIHVPHGVMFGVLPAVFHEVLMLEVCFAHLFFNA